MGRMTDVFGPERGAPRGARSRPRAGPGELFARSTTPCAISRLVGGAIRRRSVPGCVGTTFQRSTCVGEPELGEHAVHDRGRRLGRPGPGQLALRGERDARNARAAVARAPRRPAGTARRLASSRYAGEPLAALRGARSVPVEVEGPPDSGGRDPVDERTHLHPYSDRRRPAAAGDRARGRRLPRRRASTPRPRAVRLRPRARDGARRRRRDPPCAGRGVQIRLAYNVDHRSRSPCRRRPRPTRR